jgi:hypothetical protein
VFFRTKDVAKKISDKKYDKKVFFRTKDVAKKFRTKNTTKKFFFGQKMSQKSFLRHWEDATKMILLRSKENVKAGTRQGRVIFVESFGQNVVRTKSVRTNYLAKQRLDPRVAQIWWHESVSP